MKVEEALVWVADLFEIPVEAIRPETKKEEIDAWDSLGVLTLMARLDEEFQILLTEDEIQELKSVADILDLLRKNNQLEEE